ncbi:MAG: hypothetical protein KatS3mg105_0523 [Gemmatales bacterium]|nr:MAG: hypothetical protein KatS3mg105_0523 [Gemmatales bacterium]
MNERHIVIVTSVGHAICHIGELLFTGVMLAVMHEFELSRQEGPILALLGYILMGAGALPVGYWSDAFGPRKMLAVFFVAMTISSVMVACAVKPWQLFFALNRSGAGDERLPSPGAGFDFPWNPKPRQSTGHPWSCG